ncbi:MAG: replicative DNA helicase [Acidimicrobiales bacterium]
MSPDADLPRPAFAPERPSGQGRRPGEAFTGRVPPHNLQAEESLLGAMLLSRDAIANAVEVVGADDFYKPAHGHIFEAVTSLFAAGEPVDPVTVAEELSRAGLLEAIGGPASLVTIQANTPATTSAARYARIVEEHSLLRRLIQVAGEIAELGYTVPDDVAKAVDHAEALVFRVAQRRITDTLSPIRDLLSESLDRLEQLYEHGESITGIPTGYIDLDELLSGMQPSNLIVAGARPAMGKALALDTPIPTPTGWTTIGEIRPGELVFDEEGRRCQVTYVSPVFTDRVCYEVEFDDESVLVADAEHQWVASPRAGTPRVVTTRQMHDEGVHAGDRPKWYVRLAEPLDLPDADLLVDPYVLGRGLKHVPRRHLRASFKQRLDLLEGIMGTDAAVTDGAGTIEFCLADRARVERVRELVCSLGDNPEPVRLKVVHQKSGRAAETWSVRWTSRDAGTRRAVVAIRPVATVPVRCIAVDSPSHLYLAGESMIPTHNTSFALGIATHVAVHANKPVLVFSLEMSQLEVSQRILCAEARVDSTKVRTGKLSQGDWTQISHAVGRLADAPIFVDDNANISVMEIRAKSRRLKSTTGGLGLVVIDYVQLMTGRHGAESRQVEVSEISRGLKILARELDCPVLALAQLNRQLEQRADKRPMLADLRESGSLEQDSDVVVFLYRDEIYNPETPDRGTAEILVAKHRSGPTGKIRLAWLDRYTKFANMAKGM